MAKSSFFSYFDFEAVTNPPVCLHLLVLDHGVASALLIFPQILKCDLNSAEKGRGFLSLH